MSNHDKECYCPTCSAAQRVIDSERDQAADQSWAQTWCEGNWREHPRADLLIPWLRDNAHTRDIMLEFPPECLVRQKPKAGLQIPALGTVGVVKGYGDRSKPGAPKVLMVVQFPESKAGAVCHAEDLEVVGYWRGLTPEVVAALTSDA